MSKFKTDNKHEKKQQKKSNNVKKSRIQSNRRSTRSTKRTTRSTTASSSSSSSSTPEQQHRNQLSLSSPPKKRQRKASLKLLESLMQGKEEKDEKKTIKSTSTATKPRNKKNKTLKNVGSSSTTGRRYNLEQGEEQVSSSTTLASEVENERCNDHDMVCCICRCSVDYSDKEQFYWPPQQREREREQEPQDQDLCNNQDNMSDMVTDENVNRDLNRGHEIPFNIFKDNDNDNGYGNHDNDHDNNVNDDNDTTQDSDFYGVKLPMAVYDPNNALVICDGEGCNRCFHQRCHFIPILSVPRGKWHCLICQYKKTRCKSDTTRGKKRSRAKQLQYDDVGNGGGSVCETLNLSNALTLEELDQIYRVCPNDDDDGGGGGGDKVSNLFRCDNKNSYNNNNNGYNSYNSNMTLEERFEYHSAQMKAELLRKGSQQLVKMIDHYLSSIRLCQNSIRALTEANRRIRNAMIEKYIKTKQLPQELVQNVKRLAHCKLKLRQVMQTLQNFIRNKNDRKYLEEWCSKAKEGTFSLTKIYTLPKSDLPVPTVISLETSEENMERNSFNRAANELDIDALEAKLFAGQPVRYEPRFDIKDYDADANSDDDSESDDPTNKIKCCMCFSGHVEEDNDVLMCDGEHCFRAFHMKCCAPHITQRMLDEDENGVWFCPYCVCFAKTIHYVENEYFCHDIGGDDASKSSWGDAEDVFPEAVSELEAAETWREGKCNDNSEKIFAEMLGIEIHKELKNPKAQQVDDDDDSDASFVSKVISDNSTSSAESNSDECSEVDWKVDKSELSALSCSEDEFSISKESDRKETGVRKSKRLKRLNTENDGKFVPSMDIGALDTSNIVYGKRNRSNVDYNRLNDVMFGKVAASSIDDDEEYQVTLENHENGSCCSSADTAQSG